ncbi:MAG: glycosyltransferase family 9 protein [Nitrospiraceae bacterium]
MTARTILVVHPGSLGDVLLSRPALRALRTTFQKHELGLIVSGGIGGLLEAAGEVTAAFAMETNALTGLMARSASFSQPVCRWVERCDVAVCWMNDAGGRLESALAERGVARVVMQSPHSVGEPSHHQAERFLETLQLIVPRGDVPDPSLQLPQGLMDEGRARLTRIGASESQVVVALHPGSGSFHKCANPALFRRTIEWLDTRGAVPVLISGPADDVMVAAVSSGCLKPPMILRDLSIAEVAGVLSQVQLFIGHDSGLTQLAAATSIPTIAVFGPTSTQRWAPRGHHVKILTGAACQCQEWETVQACLEKRCLHVSPETLQVACEEMLRKHLATNLFV